MKDPRELLKQWNGRPRIYETPEDFNAQVDKYIGYCIEVERPVTMSGLVLYLGFASNQDMAFYAKRELFSSSVFRAKKLVEFAYEERIHEPGCQGAIFALKNMGWKDERGVTGGDGKDLFGSLADALSSIHDGDDNE